MMEHSYQQPVFELVSLDDVIRTSSPVYYNEGEGDYGSLYDW